MADEEDFHHSARSTDPETSHHAVNAKTRDTQLRARVLECYVARPEGLTEFELEEDFAARWGYHYPGHNLASIRSTLKMTGHVAWNGEYRRNPATRHKQRVWVAVENPQPVPVYLCAGCGQKCRADAPGAVLQPPAAHVQARRVR